MVIHRMARWDRHNTAKEFAAAVGGRPLLESDGCILYVRYNERTDKVEIGSPTNSSFIVDVEFDYDHDGTVQSNLETAAEKADELIGNDDVADDMPF